jgi:hypothetical protein
MNTNTTHTSTIRAAAIATAFAAIAFSSAACGAEGAPQETGTGHDRPANTSERAPVTADSAERKYAGSPSPARDRFPGATARTHEGSRHQPSEATRPGSRKFPDLGW